MAILTPGALVSTIHGSVGSSNFYKHGPWQVLRNKGLPKSATSSERAKVLSIWSRAYADAKSRYHSSIMTNVDNAASRITLQKHGITYKISGFKLMVTCNFICQYYFGYFPTYPSTFRGLATCLPFWVTLYDSPAYIRVTVERFSEIAPWLAFSWQYPQNGLKRSKMSDFPFSLIKNFAAPGNWNIPPDSYPRITGKTTLWYRARTINTYGEFSPPFIGYVTKFNWQ